MQLKPEQLADHLIGEPAPVYLLYGDEPLLVQEAADAVRARARDAGFTSREVLVADRDFEWARLQETSASLSLFAERRLLELRMPTGKPGREGADAVCTYAERPPEDCLLLVLCGKLEPAQRNSRWVKALDAAGVSIAVWPVDRARLPAWIGQRMRAAGLRPAPEAVELLADRVEGNLLACAQEIEKLRLLHGEGELGADAVAASVADSARFDVFKLVDALLAGEAARGVRILNGLRAEGVEPALVVWAIARELHGLAPMVRECARGGAPEQIMARHRVWAGRRRVVGAALKRLRPAALGSLLQRTARADRLAKGLAPGNLWDELVQLSLAIAGRRLPLKMVASSE